MPLVDAEGFPRSDIPIEEVPQCVMSGVCVCVCVCVCVGVVSERKSVYGVSVWI